MVVLHRDVADHQVTRQRGARRAEGPDVEVMDAVDAVDVAEGVGHGVGIDAGGRAFEQQVHRLAQHAVAAPEDQQADEDRDAASQIGVPVTRMSTAATMMPADETASPTMCTNAPRMFTSSRLS